MSMKISHYIYVYNTPDIHNSLREHIIYTYLFILQLIRNVRAIPSSNNLYKYTYLMVVIKRLFKPNY